MCDVYYSRCIRDKVLLNCIKIYFMIRAVYFFMVVIDFMDFEKFSYF